VSVDPLESKYSGWSSYNYGFDNPVSYSDPSGMGPGKEGQECSDFPQTAQKGDIHYVKSVPFAPFPDVPYTYSGSEWIRDYDSLGPIEVHASKPNAFLYDRSKMIDANNLPPEREETEATREGGRIINQVSIYIGNLMPVVGEIDVAHRAIHGYSMFDIYAEHGDLLDQNMAIVQASSFISKNANVYNKPRQANELSNEKVSTYTAGEVAQKDHVIKAVNDGHLPGRNGVYLGGKRLSEQEMTDLTHLHNVEFTQIYTSGKGKNGGGGYYSLYSGSVNGVDVEIRPGTYWINHTHPGGTTAPSYLDINVLKKFISTGSPQKSSVILPVGKPPVRFNIHTQTMQ